MKAKVLLIPLVIVIIVAVFIWLVYPAFSNGSDGVFENFSKLKSEKAKLSELQGKNENIKSLSAQVSTLSEKNILYAFVPESMKEEEIINSLTSLASASGILLFDSTIKQPSKESADKEAVAKKSEKTAKVAAVPQNLKVEMKLTGNYEKIRDFLKNIGKLGRNNNFETLEINRDVSKSADAPATDVLLVRAVADFGVLKKTKLDDLSATDPVFSKSSLETKIIEDIKNQKNISSLQLNIEQKGKSNLFQP